MTRTNLLPPLGLTLLLCATALLAETGHVAVISSLKGTADVTVAGKTAPATLGMELPADFCLKAGDGAKVTLLFTDGNIRFVGSKVTVDYRSAAPEAGVGENANRVVASLLSTGDARTFHDVITGARFEDGEKKKLEKNLELPDGGGSAEQPGGAQGKVAAEKPGSDDLYREMERKPLEPSRAADVGQPAAPSAAPGAGPAGNKSIDEATEPQAERSQPQPVCVPCPAPPQPRKQDFATAGQSGTTDEVDLLRGLAEIESAVPAEDPDTRAYLKARLYFKFGRMAEARDALLPIAEAKHAKLLLHEILAAGKK